MGNLFADAFNTIASQDNRAEGDFLDADGYLVCHVCKERKQLLIDVPILGGEKKVPRMCACARREYAQINAKAAQAELEAALDRIGSSGLGDPNYRLPRFTRDDRKNPEASDTCIKYVRNWEWALERGMGMLMYGNVGTGKSFLAACIVNELVEKGVLAFMTTTARIVAAAQSSSPNSVLQQLSRAKLLVLDDLGMERDNEFGNEVINSLIDSRYVARLPVIVTTNFSPQMVKDKDKLFYDRIFDRLLERSKTIFVDGPQRRIVKKRSNSADFDALEG